MKKLSLALICTAGILAAVIFLAVLVAPVLKDPQMAAVVTSSLVSQSNEEREREQISSLVVNPKLVAAAQEKASDMAKKGYFSHTSPDGSTSWSWIEDQAYEYSFAGENLAVGFSESEDVTSGWMNSPTHRANLLNAKFTEVGIATAEGMYKGKKAIFVVQMFGTPKSFIRSVTADYSVASERPAEKVTQGAEIESFVYTVKPF